MRARLLSRPTVLVRTGLTALLASASTFAQALPAPAPPAEGALPVKAPDTTSANQVSATEASPESDEGNTSYWSRGAVRPFVATAIDLGYLYLRPRASFGYGRPFEKWVGVDLNPQGSNRFLGAYGGLRFALPLVNLRVGARYVWAFQQHYLVPAAHYHRLDFESQTLARSVYTSLEAELTANLPAGPGAFLAIASGSILTGAPSGTYVYDEELRVIVDPPYVWRGRLGYALRLGREGRISIGLVADVIGVPRRDEYVLRAGLVGSATLSSHIEVLGSLVPPILSPDSIGVAGGDFAQLGVRYRWATDSPPERPVLPPPQ